MDRAQRQRLLWAGAAAILFALGPFRPRGFVSALLTGVVAGVATWVALPRLSPRFSAVELDDEGSRAGDADRVRFAPVAVFVCLALYFLFFAETLVWFYQNWTLGVWQNGHGLFVPVVMVALGVRALQGEQWERSESSPWGVVLVVVALLLALIDLPLQTRYATGVGFLLGLAGLSLAFLGTRRTRKLLLPLCLGIFMIPIPFSMSDHVFLRLSTAIAAVPLLQTLGFSVVREYTVLLFPGFSVDVSTACSGFSTLYAGAFFGVVLAAFTTPGWRKLLVLALIFPLALAANILRTIFLVELTSLYGVSVLATDIHPASGAATFILVVGALAFASGRQSIRSVFG